MDVKLVHVEESRMSRATQRQVPPLSALPRAIRTIRIDKNGRTSICTARSISPPPAKVQHTVCNKEYPVRSDRVGYGEVVDE